MEIADTLDFMLGRWEILRFLTDHANDLTGFFEGSVEVEAHPVATDSATYREAGVLRLDTHLSGAQRGLVYRRAPGGAVTTMLPAGAPFIDLDLTSGRCEAEHLCGSDVYRLAFRLLSPTCLEERWQVSGPAKDYEACATLVRLPGTDETEEPYAASSRPRQASFPPPLSTT